MEHCATPLLPGSCCDAMALCNVYDMVVYVTSHYVDRVFVVSCLKEDGGLIILCGGVAGLHQFTSLDSLWQRRRTAGSIAYLVWTPSWKFLLGLVFGDLALAACWDTVTAQDRRLVNCARIPRLRT